MYFVDYFIKRTGFNFVITSLFRLSDIFPLGFFLWGYSSSCLRNQTVNHITTLGRNSSHRYKPRCVSECRWTIS